MTSVKTRIALLLALASPALASAATPAPLADAAERADRTTLSRLLATSPETVNATQIDGMTAVLWAAYRDDTGLARQLVAAGADVRLKNRYGVTPLSLACQNGNAELVDLFLGAGADPNLPLPGGETPLLTAARTGRPLPVHALLVRGARVDEPLAKSEQTPLMWAAIEGHTEVVKVLLAAGANLHARLPSGFDALLFATRGGHVSTVRLLLASGADLDAVTAPSKRTSPKGPPAGTGPLLIAIENGHYELAAEFLDRGADPNDLRSGYAPLHVLSWVRKPDIGEANGEPVADGSGHLSSEELVRRLVAKGADVNLRLTIGGGRFSRKGCTPLLLAADRADTAYVKLLVELGADHLALNVEGGSALMTAAGLGNGADQDEAGTEEEALATVVYLMALGADPNAATENGETAVHGAAYAGFPKVIEYLDAHGARIELWNVPNPQGWTPLRIAEGHRIGNFKPSFETVAALKRIMLARGVEIPPPVEPVKAVGYPQP